MVDPVDPAADPHWRALSSELRAAVGGELRADAEEAERLASLRALRGRSLADVARDLGHRGEHVVVVLPGGAFRGAALEIASDRIRLGTSGGPVEVHVAAVTELRSAGRDAGGAPPPRAGVGFKARLFELEMAGEPVELGTGGGALRGRILAVASDHVLLADGDGERAISLAAVSYVRGVP